ncbi:uncharacterized protein LOC130591813 [Beta vulgaris subsp. vulgaris]|uniref:uncharacterized protein LOC130591813 n=1 Tax=Beta vulgaris subsp. vulgaris TaxID=3555 RepID=UPI0025466283|nr:uncharacterized protein LOC130591813 [Beta vulgaris subsp. vulgaris]
MAQLLSYAGRMQLVKTMLSSMQNYWAHIFPLSKKIIRAIVSVCRRFLWTGKTGESKKAPIAWDMLQKPKTAGGWNIINMEVWNKAAMLKLLWAIAFKTDKLWVKWVHSYYIKRSSYDTNRLATTNRLSTWGINCNTRCSLCRREDESVEHLFFMSDYAKEVWQGVCNQLRLSSGNCSFHSVLETTKRKARQKNGKLFVMAVTESFYAVWRQRNNQVFNQQLQSTTMVVRDVLFKIAVRCTEEDRSRMIV